MKALVTGGAGLIGSHVVDALLARGDEVVILDCLEQETHAGFARPPWVPDDVRFVQADIRDSNDVGRAIKGCDVVFHQAAYGGFTPRHAKLADVNCTGTAIVLSAARKAGVRKVVVASSQALYGGGRYRGCSSHGGRYQWKRSRDELERGEFELRCFACAEACHPPLPLHEDHPVHVLTTYAQTKLFAERLALRLGDEWGIPVVALRYALTYGPRQSETNPYTGVVSKFARLMLAGQPVPVYEDGRQLRDFVYVGDVAAANLVALEADERPVYYGPPEDRHVGQVFNVGTGIGTPILELVRLLGETLDVEPEIAWSGYREGDARHLVTDSSRLRGLGWEPKVALAEGLRRYVEWRCGENR